MAVSGEVVNRRELTAARGGVLTLADSLPRSPYGTRCKGSLTLCTAVLPRTPASPGILRVVWASPPSFTRPVQAVVGYPSNGLRGGITGDVGTGLLALWWGPGPWVPAPPRQ